MIYKGKERIGRIFVGNRAVSAIYLGSVKVWESVRSCFGSGVWKGKRPWRGKDRWRSR